MSEPGRVRQWVGRAFGTALIAVLAVGVALTFVDTAAPRHAAADDVRGDPTVMTEAAAEGLVTSLELTGWDCYASLDVPPLTRCFETRAAAGAKAQAELALTASGRGTISSVSVNAMSTDDDGAHRELAAQAARLIGDHLLGGEGNALEERIHRSGAVQIAGQDVWTPTREGLTAELLVRSPTAEDPVLPAPDLPSVDQLAATAGELGLRCSSPSVTTLCSDPGNGLARSVTVSAIGARTTTVVLSAGSYAARDDPRVLRKLLPLVRGSGLGGAPMLAWLRDHSRESLALGDVNGVHVELSAERADGWTTVYLTFGSIYA